MTCANCGYAACKAESIGASKTVERLRCYERTITELRAEVARLKAQVEALRRIVSGAPF